MRHGRHIAALATGLLLAVGPPARAQDEDLVERAQSLRRRVRELESARDELRQRVVAKKQRARAYSRAIYHALGRIRLMKRAERVTDQQLEKLESILRKGVRETRGEPPDARTRPEQQQKAAGGGTPAKRAPPTTAPAEQPGKNWRPVGETGFFHRGITFAREDEAVRVEGRIANRTGEGYILVTMRFVARDEKGERIEAPIFYLALFEQGETERLPEVTLSSEPADYRIELVGTEKK
jgi:outer membrane murein-binding lipoprotein Lpp